jgi:CheY-like chemotaxis protein
VHLDLSPSVAASPAASDVAAGTVPTPDLEGDLAAAAAIITQSMRPVILAGLGARSQGVPAAVRSFAERFGVPVLTTYKAKGVLPEDHVWAAGLVTNGALEGRVLAPADAILTVGFETVELMPGTWPWPRPTIAIGDGVKNDHIPHEIELRGGTADWLEQLERTLVAAGWGSAWTDCGRGARRGRRDGEDASLTDLCQAWRAQARRSRFTRPRSGSAVNEDALAELAHKLKTPIAVIAGHAELLAIRDDDETRTTAASQILAAARRLTQEVDALLGIDGELAAVAHAENGAARRSGPPARVILIDDDVFVRRLLRMTLPPEDFEIAEAGDGDIALAIAEVQRPDLVLLDWRMPTVSGETVLMHLKDRYPNVAVVVLTVEGEQRSRAGELGADAFLTKPFSPVELLRTVERLVANRAEQHVA